jgi:hypothetical protein
MDEQPRETSTDCRSEAGITVGLIDGIITNCRVLASREMQSREIFEALYDLAHDEDVKRLMRLSQEILLGESP